MPYYESVFIARPDISSAQVEALTESMSKIVTEGGGKVAQTEYWGLKSLAYRIKKNRKGHYTMLHIDAPPQAIAEMERNMRIDEDILRYLTIRSDALEEGPSVMMQSRAPRDERPPREHKEKITQSVQKPAVPKETPVESVGETSTSAAAETGEETAQ